ncbi:hypothetical protein J2J97_32175 (plasmid) [Rhizobium bangladeshense]|uniref:hypothetical protein n=1 Tax=Rhizobium bangladeshense TaxID=1138189 RepID=UPI001A98486E|nr:hypothetical protein [Rhizobium bangladeshense]QSY98563.1 hypothetical protein J2J97_32175 [Rhizobium bangladeshense]
MTYNLQQDLAHRELAQRAEILAISGPTAEAIMTAFRDKDFNNPLLIERGLEGVTDAIAAPIVAKYAKTILRSYY